MTTHGSIKIDYTIIVLFIGANYENLQGAKIHGTINGLLLWLMKFFQYLLKNKISLQIERTNDVF